MFSSMTGWFERHKKRFGLILVGHTVKQIEEYLFDWLIYGLVVSKAISQYGVYKGSLVAFGIMTPLSALLCFSYIRIYDWIGKDWFGFEALKELKAAEESGWFGKIFKSVEQLGSFPIFLLLSVHSDAFMVTVYFRKREHAHRGLTTRDWLIFWSSVLLSNAWWVLGWTVIIKTAVFLWHFAQTLLA